jgi:uncharacterized RDD family membrane protein YckC
MFCTQCGNALAEGTAFCRRCGRAVATPATAAESEQQPPPMHEPPVAPQPEIFPAPSAPPLPSSAFMPYAGFWLRVVAHFIDNAILSIAFVAIVAVAIFSIGWDRIRQTRPGLVVQMARLDYPSAVLQREFTYRGQYPLLAPAIFAAITSVFLAVILVAWLYFALMESSVKQGTLGKMALGLIVTDLYGRRISFGRASGRFFGKLITSMIPLGIGYMMAGFTEKKQALHDVLAGCLVLRKS